MNWLFARLNEPSTSAGVAAIAAAIAGAAPGTTAGNVATGVALLFGGTAFVKKG